MTDVKASRKPWSEEEKEKLLQATVDSLNGGMQVQWDAVALQFGDRTKGQLKSFFFNCLKPKMEASCYKQNVPWESRLDRQLCRLVAQHGKKWKRVSQFMPQYSPQQLKLRFFYLQKQQKTAQETNCRPPQELAYQRGAEEDQLDKTFRPVMQKIREILAADQRAGEGQNSPAAGKSQNAVHTR